MELDSPGVVVKPLNMDATVYVEEPLAEALNMWDTRTTPKALANYVAEQLGLNRHFTDSDTRAVVFLTSLVQALTPPDDRRMSFRERAQTAATAATPYEYGEVLSTLMSLGWGGLQADVLPGTVREIAEQLRAMLHNRARSLALTLLEAWKSKGLVYPIDRSPHWND